jgi:endonuclease G, mitochondrial
MREETRHKILEEVEATEVERKRVRDLAAKGLWQDAELNRERFQRYFAKRARTVPSSGAESVQGDTLDYQPVSFLVEGAVIRRAVAYVEASYGTETSMGSGFLVSPRLFVTNQHVIPDAQAALGAIVTFDREVDERGRPRKTTSFALDPEAFALFSDEGVLDYALIAIGERQSGDGQLSDFGYCPLSPAGDKHVIGMSTNVVHHPGGMRKLISIRNNILVARSKRTLLYESDTQTGSSGAPVFNDDWDVVALHHWGEPFLEPIDDQGQSIRRNVNEGVRVSAVVGATCRTAIALATHAAGLAGRRRRLRRYPIVCWVA